MKFINKYPNIRYVVSPMGQTIVDGKVVTRPGKAIQFEGGELITNDKETIAHLKSHPDFGVSMFADEPKKADEVKKEAV